ncbi:MAG: G8 domain-containing protein, partial [Opitutaceae bacterium]|nr:G8 domain-containing protein [Opitutaceae bacterium]
MNTPLRLLAAGFALAAACAPLAAATKTAAADGNWTAAATWSPSGAPAAGDDVVIPAGIDVVYDSTSTAVLKTVKIRGTLQFRTTASTNLSVGVLTVGPDTVPGAPDAGALIVGQPGAPVPRGVTATIQLAALSGQNTSDHPALFNNGGRWVMQGASLANPWTRLTANAAAGATTVTVADSVSDWAVGDEVLVVASRNSKNNFADAPPSYRTSMTPESETRTITAINTSTKTLTLNSALTYSHSGYGGHYPE